MPEGLLLHPLPAPLEGVTGKGDDVEGVHHRDRVRQRLGGGGLEAGEPVHRHDLDAFAPGLRTPGQPGLERLLGPALDHVQKPGRAGLIADRREVDDDGDVLVALAGVPPDVLIDADHLHPVKACGVADQDPSALGEDGVVGGVPGDPQGLGDAGDRQVLTDDRRQRPTQRTPGQLGARLGGLAGVLPPHVSAP